MANHKSAIKRNRQNIKRRERNRSTRSTLRSSVAKVKQLIKSGDKVQAKEALKQAESLLSKAAVKRTVHPGNARRRIGRLARMLAAAK